MGDDDGLLANGEGNGTVAGSSSPRKRKGTGTAGETDNAYFASLGGL